MTLGLPDQMFIQQRINAAISELLASDPANVSYLETLNDTSIVIDVSNPALTLYFRFTQNQIQLQTLQEEDQPQFRIKGKALNLAKLLSSPIDSAAKLRELGIEVTGDVGLLLEISQLANRIEIDWEYLLSEKIGETPAVLLSRATKTAQTQAIRARNDFQHLIRAQLNKHSDLPTNAELEITRREIRELGYRLDRLELAAKQGKN